MSDTLNPHPLVDLNGGRDTTAQGASRRGLQHHNVAAVLRSMWTSEPATASSLIAATGLTRTTVLGICHDLLERGWLTELETQRTAGPYRNGRPAHRYTLNRHAGVIVGIHMRPRRVLTRISDLLGATLVETETPLSPGNNAARSTHQEIGAAVTATFAAANIPSDRTLATTIGTTPGESGTCDHDDPEGCTNRIKDSPPYGPSTNIFTGAQLAAVAEGWLGHGIGTDNYATLLIEEQLSAGIVIDGRLLRGTHGQFGNRLPQRLPLTSRPRENIDQLARRWTHEALASSNAPASVLAHDSPSDITLTRVLTAASQQDRIATAITDRLGRHLQGITTALRDLYELDGVVLAGMSADTTRQLVDHLNRADRTQERTVHASTLGQTIVLTGANITSMHSAQGYAVTAQAPSPRETAVPTTGASRLD